MGYFHPLLVHLPIGILILAIGLDLVAYRPAFHHYRKALGTILFFGFLAALLSGFTGYLLSGMQDYEAERLQMHQNGGWVLIGFSGILWLLYSFIKPLQNWRIWRTTLFLMLGGLLVYTTHQGASLTHGSGYLSLSKSSNAENHPAALKPDSNSIDLPPINPDLPRKVDSEAIEQLRKRGFNVRYMLKKPVMLDITLAPQSGISLAESTPALQALAKSIVWLNLSDNGFTTKDLSWLNACQNLEKLKLAQNPIGDDILEIVQGLKHLEALNLNATPVRPETVLLLQKIGIKRVYHWSPEQ